MELRNNGVSFSQGVLTPGPVSLTFYLQKKIHDFAQPRAGTSPIERAEGLEPVEDSFSVKTRTHLRTLDVTLKKGVVYEANAAWVVDEKDDLWRKGMRADHIRVWITQVDTGEVVASSPPCTSKLATPEIRTHIDCWYSP